jgi:chromosome segregation ATPase
VAEVADKKARELQALNAQLVSQLRDGESQLQQKSNDLKRMKTEQERADRVIRDLARKSEMNRQEIDGFRNELEVERRQTSANQEGVSRKIKSMEEEKRKL